jgi:hypothetical protein
VNSRRRALTRWSAGIPQTEKAPQQSLEPATFWLTAENSGAQSQPINGFEFRSSTVICGSFVAFADISINERFN